MPDIFGPYPEPPESRPGVDYRDRTTQARDYTRHKMKECEFLRHRNRVNQGPWRNHRAKFADCAAQVPHVWAAEDMWGWQAWVGANEISEEVSELVDTGLYEEILPDDVPGRSYQEEVGGAAYIPEQIRLDE